MIGRPRTGLLLVGLLATLPAAELDAQVRRGRATQAAPAGWTPISLGIHAGYDDASRAELLGAHAFVPILRSGRIQVIPSAQVTFLSGAKEYQYSLDVAFVDGGPRGGLFVGGGIGSRDSVVDATPADPRGTFRTFHALAGFQSGLIGRFQTQLQIRWIFLQDVQADFRPIAFTLGVSFPLWRPSGQGS